jgi:hypothetical protein
VDAPSSEAVEEAGHCEKNCTPLALTMAKRTKIFENTEDRGKEEGEIANNAGIAQKPNCRPADFNLDSLAILAILAFLAILFGLGHKLSRLHLPCTFYLHKDAILARLGKAIWERHFGGGSVVLHIFHCRFGIASFG